MFRFVAALRASARTDRNDEPFVCASWNCPGVFPSARHAHGVNRRDGAGKADGGDAVGRHWHGDDHALVEREALDGFGWFCQRDGGGQQEEANW